MTRKFNKKSISSVALALIGLSAATVSINTFADGNQKVLFGYYSNWSTYDRNYQPSDIPITDLTHALYAFAEIGNCAAPFATDSQPDLCNGGSYADGKQDYKLYSSDPYSDYNIVPSKFPSGRVTGYGYAGTGGKGNMAKTINAAHNAGKQALLSIGGYTLSVPFFTAMEPRQVQAFTDSITDFLDSVKADNVSAGSAGFDGVDIDWEPNDNSWSFVNSPVTGRQTLQNYLNFLDTLRTALIAKNPHALLTVAMPASPEVVQKVEKLYPGFWKDIASKVDYFNIMAYDYHGAFDSPAITNFMAPLQYDPNQPENVVGRTDFNVTATLAAYTTVGVPSNKIVLGFPTYGRATTGVVNTSPTSHPESAGLYQAFTGSPSGQYNDGTGVYNYSYILNTMLKSTGGYTASYVANLGTTAYNPANQMFIAYDDVSNINEKAAFALTNQLAGMMEWELSGDLLAKDSQYNTLSLLHNAKIDLQAGE